MTVLALFSFGMRYLYRNHPLARIFSTGFCRGFSAGGGDKPAVQVAAALVQEAPSEG